MKKLYLVCQEHLFLRDLPLALVNEEFVIEAFNSFYHVLTYDSSKYLLTDILNNEDEYEEQYILFLVDKFIVQRRDKKYLIKLCYELMGNKTRIFIINPDGYRPKELGSTILWEINNKNHMKMALGDSFEFPSGVVIFELEKQLE